MNILLVAQCTKNALAQTRRVLDQFAERCGTRTWQTHITQQGLDTLRTLLKRTARRNTAVACHWIRGKNQTDLLWVVGNASFFNEKGAVPTNTTERDILRKKDENDWHTLPDIQILAAIAALFHDFGKANRAFQRKLMNAISSKPGTSPKAEPYRHEWVSLRLFQAFVANSRDDQSWLSRLANLTQDKTGVAEQACLDALIKDSVSKEATNPFKNLPPIARMIAWLIVSHHRLPQPPKGTVQNSKAFGKPLLLLSSNWNSARVDAPDVTEKEKQACWQFDKRLPFASIHWRERASYWGGQALRRSQLFKIDVNDLYTLHLARLSLILADHHYSGLPAHSNLGDENFPLFANTDRKTGSLKQRLDEHLVGVAKHAKRIVETLPLLDQILPRIARHKGFKRRATDPRFRWQDQAYDVACGVRESSISQGFFGINMASTGCGKTFANGRIMYGLANPTRGARFCIALGLRTLTLQTGKAYRERLKLGEDDLAILVGSAAVKELFELNEQANETIKTQDESTSAAYGSESVESLWPDDSYVHFEGALTLGPLKQWIGKNPHANKLLAAPILTCTIDYLMDATEATRGGKQIAPMLRLLTSDLVLDEPDDFDMADLPALSRLVHWAAMLGSRVLLSSATLPPALVGGLFSAYQAGRAMFDKSRGIPGKPSHICCAWFDEYNSTTSDYSDPKDFLVAHQQFVFKRVTKLYQAPIQRRAIIKTLDIRFQKPIDVRQQFADRLHTMLHELHRQHHSVDEQSNKRVSFGLIRLANIDPLIDVAQQLFKYGAQAGYQIKLCCYHSRHPLLVRSHIEYQLDRMLTRHQPTAIFTDPLLRATLDGDSEQNIIFVVLASPVAEVGRDHDYDWAIVEPSSMRSIIQLAGRIKRHRNEICTVPNIYLLDHNIKSLEQRDGSVTYYRPGFEKADRFSLHSHNLTELLNPDQYEVIDAIPRIQAREGLTPNHNFADLEHARLQSLMLDQAGGGELPISCWWQGETTLSGALQQATRFRNSQKQQRFALLWDEDEQETNFYKLIDNQKIAANALFKRFEFQLGERIEPWGILDDYAEALSNLADKLGLNIEGCGKRFGTIDLPEEDNSTGWWYSPVLGLRRKGR